MNFTTKRAFLTVICSLILGVSSLFAQRSDIETESFKVYGNCGMCKGTIERTLKKKDGVLKKSWDPKTKMMTITFNPEKITIEQIHQKIAEVGYDTELVKAKDETYNKLHGCCKYERP